MVVHEAVTRVEALIASPPTIPSRERGHRGRGSDTLQPGAERTGTTVNRYNDDKAPSPAPGGAREHWKSRPPAPPGGGQPRGLTKPSPAGIHTGWCEDTIHRSWLKLNPGPATPGGAWGAWRPAPGVPRRTLPTTMGTAPVFLNTTRGPH